MLKVLFLTNNPNLGSTARILQSWLLLAQQNNLRGYVIAQRPGPLPEWLRANQVPHAVDPMPTPDRRWPFPSLWHAWKMARWARNCQIDVIHCNEHDLYPFGLLLRRLLKRPLVCYARYHVSREMCQWLFGRPARQPDLLLWTSKQQRADCAASVEGIVPPDRQALVYLGIDPATFAAQASSRSQWRQNWGIAADAIVLGTASALRPRKRIEDFIEVVIRLAKCDPRIVGLLAGEAMPGDESYRAGLFRRMEESGLGRRLQWLGHLEPIEPLYHASDIFISSSAYETFGNSVCEAMACGRPVVAYRGGSVQEVVGETGLIVETGDLDALTAKVLELVREPERRQQLGERARRRVAEQFSPSNSLRHLKRLYESILATPTPWPSVHPSMAEGKAADPVLEQ